MSTQQQRHTTPSPRTDETPVGSIIQVLRDHSIIDSTVRGLLDEHGLHPSDVRVFAFGECARNLRFRPALAALVTELEPDNLRASISGGALDERQVDWIMANLLDGATLLVAKVYSDQARKQIGNYFIKRREDEKFKQEVAGHYFELGNEDSQPRERVSATEKATDRRSNHSSRYSRASRTEGVGNWGVSYR